MTSVLLWLALRLRRAAVWLERRAGVDHAADARDLEAIALAALTKHAEQLASEGRAVPSHMTAEIERLGGRV